MENEKIAGKVRMRLTALSNEIHALTGGANEDEERLLEEAIEHVEKAKACLRRYLVLRLKARE